MAAGLQHLYDPAFYQTANGGSHRSAYVCAPIVAELLRPSSVVDIGCGQGEWLAAFAELGVSDYEGVDGPHIGDDRLLIPRERFTPHDLTLPLALGRRFDLALSLEVGEHLPAHTAPRYVQSLVALASAVVFSAAVPGQGGIHHISEQWPWFWKELFERHGYVQLDPFRKLIWGNPKVAVYYQHNLYLYVHRDAHAALVDQVGVPDKYNELTLIRTSILQELTEAGPATRLLRRIRNRLNRLFGRVPVERPIQTGNVKKGYGRG